MAGDTLWLSPSYADDRIGIHFSWRREPDAVQAITAAIMDLTAHSDSPILYHKEIGDAASNRAFPSVLPR